MAPTHCPVASRRPAGEQPPLYVAPFAGEGPCDYTVTTDEGRVKLHGLSLPDHVDEHGITWEPWGGTPTGRQEHGNLHPVRQRRCMRQLVCGGCGEQPHTYPQSDMLWVLACGLPHERTWPLLTTAPPFCEPCAEQAVQDCHALRNGSVRVRATTSHPVGVAGTLHLPGHEPEDRVVLFDDGAIHYVVARHLVRRVEGAVSASDRPMFRPPARIAAVHGWKS